jgi:uncharacterized protein YggE
MSSKLICLIGLMAIALCMTTASAQDSSLRVIGVGTVQVPADTAIIAVSAQNDSENATLAATSNSELLNRTERSLIDAGVKKEEIMPDRSKGYMTSHRVICDTVNNTTSCRDLVTNVVAEHMIIRLKTNNKNQTQKVIDTAKSVGVEATIDGYALSDSSKAVDEARKKALDDAKAKAEDYASSFGFSLGKAMEIEEPTYPDIEIAPTDVWDMHREMNHMFRMEPFYGMNCFFGDNYIPEGMAEVTAYVSVTYKV